ncbi:glycosyltransferase [Xenorhabdus sp. ZM]|uniref:glycosyltransferase n=1 Tax=Xenorhabdus szentirmaii TaxID=290112 RepID=UPI00199081F5|nr:glycosyltransferase [Xenorhabdus sp. ZM]MBD2804164.1 glycosyltransferase [Xenorhabdus sp. ZM]
MKVLFLITGLGLGGAEKQVVLLANKMLERGNDVTIISLTGETIVTPNSRVTIYNIYMKKNPYSFTCALIKVNKIIKKTNPDIVHSHMFHANIFSRILKIFTYFPVLICTAHNSNEGNKLRMFFYRITDHIATISTNVSQEAVNSFLEKNATSPGRMLCIYNGIDTDKFIFSKIERNNYREKLNISTDTKVILSIGRLTKAKDYPNLFKAYHHLIKNSNFDQKIIVVIAGYGELLGELEKYVQSMNISEHVFFLGAKNDIEKLINIADVFVLSSEWEGFGLVVAEAMACERLVVATDSGGIREVVGDCGYVVPIKNERLLAEGMQKALKLPVHDQINIGQRSRDRIINHYSIDAVVDRWLEIYIDLNSKH